MIIMGRPLRAVQVGNGYTLDAPLTTSLALTLGTGSFTFARTSTATVTDFEGVIKTARSGEIRIDGARRVENILRALGNPVTSSDNLTNAFLNATTATFSGQETVYTVASNSGGSYARFFTVGDMTVNLGIGTGDTYNIVLDIKGIGSSIGKIIAVGSGAGGDALTPITHTLTGTYQRINFARPPKINNLGDYPLLAFKIAGFGGDCALNDQIYVKNVVIEKTTGQANKSPSEYVSSGILSSPYHGAGVDGVKYFNTLNGNTVDSNVVTEATGAAISASTIKGVNIEASRVNIISGSADIASWSIYGGASVISQNSSIAPDGTTSADAIRLTSANTDSNIYKNQSFASSAWTFSVWVKRNAATNQKFQLFINSQGVQTLSDDLTATDTWNRFFFTSTNPSTDQILCGIVANTTGTTSNIFIWGMQLESGGFASSYIPTTTSAVTRNTETNYIQSTSNINSSAGTLSFDFTPSHAPSGTIYLWESYVDASNSTSILHDGTNLIFRKRIAGVDYDSYKTFDFAAGTTYAIKAIWNTSSGSNVTIDGVSGVGNSNTAALQLGTNMYIGSDGQGANQAFGNFKNYTVSPKTSNLETFDISLSSVSNDILVDENDNQLVA